MFFNTNGEITSVSVYRNVNDRIFADTDQNLLPSKEKAEAVLALCQLMMLREYYNDGWKRQTDYTHFAIRRSPDGEWYCFSTLGNFLFTFKTETLAKQFLENFKDLFEKLNPLYE